MRNWKHLYFGELFPGARKKQPHHQATKRVCSTAAYATVNSCRLDAIVLKGKFSASHWKKYWVWNAVWKGERGKRSAHCVDNSQFNLKKIKQTSLSPVLQVKAIFNIPGLLNIVIVWSEHKEEDCVAELLLQDEVYPPLISTQLLFLDSSQSLHGQNAFKVSGGTSLGSRCLPSSFRWSPLPLITTCIWPHTSGQKSTSRDWGTRQDDLEGELS